MAPHVGFQSLKSIYYCRVNVQSAQKASEISFDVESQRVTLSFDEEVGVSKSAVIQIKYAGTMNNTMAGFYRSRYKPAVTPAPSVPKQGDYHYMFSTQFESGDARRAFPCFDEPNLKATFDFSIEVPEDQVALSNMPEKGVEQVKNGLKVVSFDRTPLMSTYVSHDGNQFFAGNDMELSQFPTGHISPILNAPCSCSEKFSS